MFFALWPDEAARAALYELALALKADAGGRLTRAAKLHMTLVFLGDVARARVAELERIAQAVATNAFAMRIERTGYWSRQQIVWAAPQVVPAALSQLVAALEAGLRAAGFQLEDRAWQPHITLLRDARRPSISQCDATDWPVNDFVLVESARGEYRVIGSWNLAAI